MRGGGFKTNEHPSGGWHVGSYVLGWEIVLKFSPFSLEASPLGLIFILFFRKISWPRTWLLADISAARRGLFSKYLSLELICSSKLRVRSNCSHPVKDHVRRQISIHIFALNGGCCLDILRYTRGTRKTKYDDSRRFEPRYSMVFVARWFSPQRTN